MPLNNHKTDSYNTLVGRVPNEKLKEVTELAGIRWDDEVDQWVMIYDVVDAKRINPSNDRRAGEKQMTKFKTKLPIRYYNFLYAASKSNWEVDATIKYAKMNCFDIADDPVYLPDTKNMNYSKLMELVSRKEREFYDKNFDKIKTNSLKYLC